MGAGREQQSYCPYNDTDGRGYIKTQHSAQGMLQGVQFSSTGAWGFPLHTREDTLDMDVHQGCRTANVRHNHIIISGERGDWSDDVLLWIIGHSNSVAVSPKCIREDTISKQLLSHCLYRYIIKHDSYALQSTIGPVQSMRRYSRHTSRAAYE